MQSHSPVTFKDIRIEVIRHKGGLLYGTSPDLPGLIHTARDEEQFEAEIGDVIREMLEATGHRVLRIENKDHLSRSPWLSTSVLRTTAEMEAG
jgi:hypothetical protein